MRLQRAQSTQSLKSLALKKTKIQKQKNEPANIHGVVAFYCTVVAAVLFTTLTINSVFLRIGGDGFGWVPLPRLCDFETPRIIRPTTIATKAVQEITEFFNGSIRSSASL